MAYKEDGEVMSDDDWTDGMFWGGMMEFRERSGYRSVTSEDTLTDESNTDSGNTDAEYLFNKYIIGRQFNPYDLHDDGTIDTSLWTVTENPNNNSRVKIREESGYLEATAYVVEAGEGPGQSADGNFISDNDLFSNTGKETVTIDIPYWKVSCDSTSEFSRAYLDIYLTDDSGSSANIFSKQEVNNGDEGASSSSGSLTIRLEYDSSLDEVEVYHDNVLQQTIDVSGYSSKQVKAEVDIDHYNMYLTGTESTVRWDYEKGFSYDTSNTYTYQTSSLTSLSRTIQGGLLIYEEDEVQIPDNTSLTVYASSDGGSNWTQVNRNGFIIPSGERGTDLRFKFELETSDSSITPEINKWKYMYLTETNP